MLTSFSASTDWWWLLTVSEEEGARAYRKGSRSQRDFLHLDKNASHSRRTTSRTGTWKQSKVVKVDDDRPHGSEWRRKCSTKNVTQTSRDRKLIKKPAFTGFKMSSVGFRHDLDEIRLLFEPESAWRSCPYHKFPIPLKSALSSALHSSGEHRRARNDSGLVFMEQFPFLVPIVTDRSWRDWRRMALASSAHPRPAHLLALCCFQRHCECSSQLPLLRAPELDRTLSDFPSSSFVPLSDGFSPFQLRSIAGHGGRASILGGLTMVSTFPVEKNCIGYPQSSEKRNGYERPDGQICTILNRSERVNFWSCRSRLFLISLWITIARRNPGFSDNLM
jgi:hypothetical protein